MTNKIGKESMNRMFASAHLFNNARAVLAFIAGITSTISVTEVIDADYNSALTWGIITIAPAALAYVASRSSNREQKRDIQREFTAELEKQNQLKLDARQHKK